MYRVCIVYLSYIYRVSIVYLSCLYRTQQRNNSEKKGESKRDGTTSLAEGARTEHREPDVSCTEHREPDVSRTEHREPAFNAGTMNERKTRGVAARAGQPPPRFLFMST